MFTTRYCDGVSSGKNVRREKGTTKSFRVIRENFQGFPGDKKKDRTNLSL